MQNFIFNSLAIIFATIVVYDLTIKHERSCDLENFDAFMENSPFIIYIKDCKGRIIKANDKFTQELQCSQKDLKKLNLAAIYPEELYRISCQDDDFIKANKTFTISYRQIAFNNNGAHWYKIFKMPIKDRHKQINKILVCLENIDKEKMIAEQKTAFVAHLSHDLKTPSTSLVQALKLLLNGSYGTFTKTQQNMLEIMYGSSIHLNNIVSTLIQTYIYENGIIKLIPEKFNMNELITEVQNEVRYLKDDNPARIKIKNELADNYINADRLQLKRVLVNLLSNAVTYGIKDKEIEISLKSDSEKMDINIINQSKFSPSETFDHIFEKFRSLDNSKFNNFSTGLGLYLSKEIINLHNGKIYAEKLPDDKCKFGFTIPIMDSENEKILK